MTERVIKMKAIRVNSPKNIEIADVAMPNKPLEEEVFIKIKAAGICGSDLHIYHGSNPMATYPRIIGHEFVGEVIEIGNKINDLQVGDHVTIDPVISCGTCYPCSVGRNNVCTSLKVRGVHIDGGFCEYVTIPRQNVYKIPSDIPWETAALIEPYSIAAQVLARGEIVSGDTVLIFGAGPIGLIILQAVKKVGAKAIITDIVKERLEMALQMGADKSINTSEQDMRESVMKETHGLGVTVVVDAVGLPQLLEEGIQVVSPAARIVLLGFGKTPSQIVQLDITKNELDIRGSRLSAGKFPQVIEWFNKREVNPEKLISHTFHFTEIEKALHLIETEPMSACKIVLLFDK